MTQQGQNTPNQGNKQTIERQEENNLVGEENSYSSLKCKKTACKQLSSKSVSSSKLVIDAKVDKISSSVSCEELLLSWSKVCW